ncbi:MAG: hypothetical protein HKN21_14830 [Candidatus Eisenbacteria bacterium]|uniref:Bifunctional metallophosphatase/5'-nucleotidase n=1 Tax=Eiseniibacteriota bacterium TaxID=2212470 RepID=A0A7Y2EA48_UNCEI|nr:hypothetical protein [Candidatus Eisenbacteria bacterium]
MQVSFLKVVPALLLSASLAFPLGTQAEEESKVISIVSSASLNGELESCGCKKKDIGGIARKATLVDRHREKVDGLLVLDAGNFSETKKFESWERTKFLWKLMAESGTDCVTPGDRELIHGHAGMMQLVQCQPDIKIVSANITDKQGDLLWDRYTVIERGGVRVGITGVTSPTSYAFNLTRGTQEADDFDFLDPKESLAQAIADLEGQCDVVVALLHETPGDARRIVEEIPGMDVAIVGHNPGYMFSPDRIGNTLLVRGGSRGQYTSFLDLTLDSDNAIIDYNGESKPLGKTIKPKPQIHDQVTEYLDAYKDRELANTRAEALKKAGYGSD